MGRAARWPEQRRCWEKKKRVARPATRYKKRREVYAAAGAAFFRRVDLRRVVLRAVLRAAFLRPPVFLRAAFLRPPVFLRAAFLRPPAFLRLDFLRVDLRAVDLRAVFLRRVVDLRAARLRGAAFLAALLRAAFLRLTAIVGGVILSLATSNQGCCLCYTVIRRLWQVLVMSAEIRTHASDGRRRDDRCRNGG